MANFVSTSLHSSYEVGKFCLLKMVKVTTAGRAHHYSATIEWAVAERIRTATDLGASTSGDAHQVEDAWASVREGCDAVQGRIPNGST